LFDPQQDQVVYRYAEEKLFEITQEGNRFLVSGTWIENLVRTTNFEQHESLQYFQRLIRRKGVIEALEEAGIQPGDTVSLHDFEFEYYP
jgi:GTP-binding protein